MQPSLPPWAWVSWEVRARSRAAAPHKFAIYDVRKDTRHFIRLDRLGKSLLLSSPWAGTAAPVWRYERLDNTPPWRDHAIKSVGSFPPLPLVPAGGADAVNATVVAPAGAEAAAGPAEAEGGARGWAVAAVVFAVLIMCVRVSETCLKAALKTHPIIRNAILGAQLQSAQNYAMNQVQHREAPPSYAECMSPGAPREHEPPPPYAACAPALLDAPPLLDLPVAPPQYILHERPPSTTDLDNARNDLIENGITHDNIDHLDSGGPMELVFADGRVVERVSADMIMDSDKKAGDEAKELNKDKVVYIDETATNNATPDTVLLV